MLFLINFNIVSYLKYFSQYGFFNLDGISLIGLSTLADFNISCVSQGRSYKKATSKELWCNWKHFPFNIANSVMHSFHKQASCTLLGSIFGTARHTYSWRHGLFYIRVYNYVYKNAQNLLKRQCLLSVIKWYKLIVRKVQRKEQFLPAGMTMDNTKKDTDFLVQPLRTARFLTGGFLIAER